MFFSNLACYCNLLRSVGQRFEDLLHDQLPSALLFGETKWAIGGPVSSVLAYHADVDTCIEVVEGAPLLLPKSWCPGILPRGEARPPGIRLAVRCVLPKKLPLGGLCGESLGIPDSAAGGRPASLAPIRHLFCVSDTRSSCTGTRFLAGFLGSAFFHRLVGGVFRQAVFLRVFSN